jgi:hypothetical protein
MSQHPCQMPALPTAPRLPGPPRAEVSRVPPGRATPLSSSAILGACLLAIALPMVAASLPACQDANIQLTPDYRYLIGSAAFADTNGDAEAGSSFRWIRNGSALASGRVAESLLLAFDGTVGGANGETPLLAASLQFTNGRWGSALALPASGRLRFAATNELPLDQGTLELWVALRADGTNSAYASHDQVLVHYRAPNGDSLQIAQSRTSGILYVGGTVNGQWESAYGGRADMRSWLAGQWHHLAFTYSAASNFMRFYVDGTQTAANNEGHYWPPAAGGSAFSLGGDLSGNNADYWLDDLRISGRVADPDEIAARARRIAPAQANEVWLPAAAVNPGDDLVFEYTPETAAASGTPCSSSLLHFTGIPMSNPQPASTLLAAGTDVVDLALDTAEPTACAYSVGTPLPYEQMTRFAQGAGSQHHQTRVGGLNPDPQWVNSVFVRCAAHPDYLLRLRYRAVSAVNPPFPRTGNLWGWWQWRSQGLPYMARVDLWLGAQPPPDEIRELRRLNPNLRLLTSINAVENEGLPPDYYLKDVNGRRIEVWPGSYRLNLTKPYVAEYQARFAYDTVLATDLMADGVFFDNVMTTQSWQQQDIYGNPVQIDANEDGQADDPAAFDAAWKAGVFHEIRAFRELMPHAIINGHSMNIYEPGIADLFNGISLGFVTANVLEGEESFGSVWNRYQDWTARAVPPVAVMVESSPRDQIAYGYDYSPDQKIPASTLEFARTFYPDVRFGLTFTLMGDGFFAHEYGDTWHGNDWWYDELDFKLGYPLGPAQRVGFPGSPGTNLIVNAGFESPIVAPWRFSVNTGCAATLTRDTLDAPAGTACARVEVATTTGTDWHIELAQYSRSLEQGVAYDFTFRARSSLPRPITVSAQKSSADWRNYGLWGQASLTNGWRAFTFPFAATETVSDARLQFFLGATNGTVWIDDVQLTRHPPDVFRRDFTHGLALLNGTRDVHDVTLGPGFHRLSGSQAPMIERIIDDTNAAFSVTGGWTNTTRDSGEWKASGPFYHNWGGSLHERTDAAGEARWQLPIEIDDTYTISAWWPAAPAATNWTPQALYEVVTGGRVVAVANLDQRVAGDEWHTLATVELSATNATYVRLTAPDGVCVADALYLRSASRYNNGQPAEVLRLQPMDGIVLARDQPVPIPPRLSQIALSPTNLVLAVADLTPGLTHELQYSQTLRSNDWGITQTFLPTGYTATVAEPARASPGFYRLHVP